MQFLFPYQVKTDLFNLLRRAAMHGAQGDVIRDTGWYIDVINGRIYITDAAFCTGQFCRAILHPVKKPLNIIL